MRRSACFIAALTAFVAPAGALSRPVSHATASATITERSNTVVVGVVRGLELKLFVTLGMPQVASIEVRRGQDPSGVEGGLMPRDAAPGGNTMAGPDVAVSIAEPGSDSATTGSNVLVVLVQYN